MSHWSVGVESGKRKSIKRRCKLKRAGRRLQDPIRRLLVEVHRQSAKYLASMHDRILLRSVEASQMIQKADSKIGSKAISQLKCWSHFRFRQRLVFKCQQHGIRLAVVNEACTSRHCSSCGHGKRNQWRKGVQVVAGGSRNASRRQWSKDHFSEELRSAGDFDLQHWSFACALR